MMMIIIMMIIMIVIIITIIIIIIQYHKPREDFVQFGLSQRGVNRYPPKGCKSLLL